MMSIEEYAHAKINLTLDVVGERPDGYHELRTVFQSLQLCDTLTFSHNHSSQITLACNIPGLPVHAENLVWQAASLLKDACGITQGVHIILDKKIPVAAGLGGGSSDAAAALRGLVRFWELPTEPALLYSLAAKLGSDVPFCIGGGTALGSGRGEILVKLPPCPHFYVVLANPGFPVSTAHVFQELKQREPKPKLDVDGLVLAVRQADADGIMNRLGNVLESSTFSLYPAVEELKEKMLQAGPALMCGSGATVFALFRDRAAAKRLHAYLLTHGTDSWLTETYNNSQEV
jgi:4-diphosphocytidyl-2-C-methyl-D-erythritol kinase